MTYFGPFMSVADLEMACAGFAVGAILAALITLWFIGDGK